MEGTTCSLFSFQTYFHPTFCCCQLRGGGRGVMNKRITSVRGEDRASEGRRLPGFLPERGRERAPMQCLIWYSTALFLGESGCLVSGEAARGRGLICAHSLLPWTAHRAISAICPQPIIPRPSCTGCLTALIVKRGDYRVECRDWQVPEGPAALVAEWTPSDTVLSLKAYFLVV